MLLVMCKLKLQNVIKLTLSSCYFSGFGAPHALRRMAIRDSHKEPTLAVSCRLGASIRESARFTQIRLPFMSPSMGIIEFFR